MDKIAKAGRLAAGVPKVRSLSEAYDVARNAAAKTTELYKCDECAKNIVDALKAKGIQGELLETVSRTGQNTALGSHRFGPVATSSFHQAVQVGELVFDNWNPNGIKFADWVADLYTNGGFKLKITPF